MVVSVERYARAHETTVSELVARFLQRLQETPERPIHPDVEAISALIPADLDAEALYREHLTRKYSRHLNQED